MSREAFGFQAGTTVATPEGSVAIELVSVGDRVLSWDIDAEARREATVTALHRWTVDHVVDVDVGDGWVRGAAPATNFWDDGDEAFRAAGSLSTLSELLRQDGDGGVTATTVAEVVERHAPGTTVHQLTLDRRGATWFADRVLTRHKETP